MRWLALAIVLAGCRQIIGIQDLHTTDAASIITLSGAVKSNDSMPIPSASLELLRGDDLMPLASTTSDAVDATYLFAIPVPPTNTFVHASDAAHVQTDQFFASPLDADTMLTIYMLTQHTIDDFAGPAQVTTDGFLFAIVQDATGIRIPNATIALSGAGTVEYLDANGHVSASATGTDGIGLALAYNVGAGMQDITATTMMGTSGTTTVRVIGGRTTVVKITIP